MPEHSVLTGRFHTKCHNRFGHMRAVSDGHHLIRLNWDQHPFDTPDNSDDVSRETCHQIAAYLAGERQRFDLPLMAEGKPGTARSWLAAMALIPYGTTISYAGYAALAGKPRAPRAAGTACSGNPIPIIYPCHRVVRQDGSLGRYGGGSTLPPRHPENLDRKRALIDLERGFA